MDLEADSAETEGTVSHNEEPVSTVESGAKDLLNEVMSESSGSRLDNLLPDYPEINTKINIDREVISLQKGTGSMKDEIMREHENLENLFNGYGMD